MGLKRWASARKVGWTIVVALVMVGSTALTFVAETHATPAALTGASSAASSTALTASKTRPHTTAHLGSSPAAANAPAGAGPHPGTLDIYENTGGGTTMDPASAYNTVNAEPIWNVYETLLAYNGSSTTTVPSGFVPQGATCVPGSAECTAQFGSNLTFDNATVAGQVQYYTFEIDAGARFYDPNTSVSYPVYPSDVAFSFARTMAFAEQPFLEAYPGWIQSQALLPKGNPTWDNGIHYPYNNTPEHIMSAILVNDSAYCPAPIKAGLKTNGCVTFNVGASGAAWPEFLQLVADPMGGAIEPCGKFTSVGAPVPGFNGTGALHGDGACTLPYGTTSTSQPGYAAYLKSLKPTGWDSYEEAGGASYPSAQPAVQWRLYGSGPYYVTEVNAAVGYFLRANPAYHAPVGCAGQVGCLPEPGDYASVVNVYWNDGDATGLQQMAGGFADEAEIFPADFGELKSLVSSGKYGLLQNLPTLSFFFTPFELNFSLSAEAQIDSTGEINVPGTWFSNLAIREFMVNAMPYTSLISNVYTSDGIVTGEGYGGVLPHGMGNYYPTNVSWPSGNPTSAPTKVGNVTWWWKQATTKGSAWYDPAAAKCSSSSPCRFPVISLSGFSVYDDQANLWITSIKSLTGNALQPYLLDIPPTTEGVSVGLPPGQGNMPDYPYGWAPDYPDPTDNIPTMYAPAGTYTVPDAVAQQLESKAFMNVSAPACAGHTSGLTSFAALAYWANLGQLPNACQGFAFETMADWIPVAGADTDVTSRVLYYNLIEHIANELALYMYSNQGINVIDYASWINPAGINTNPMIGGGGDQLWSFWGYSTHVYNVTVSESGLAPSTKWSATLGTTTLSNTTAGSTNTITFPGLPNGTYNYSVQFETGYSVSPASAQVTIHGANLTVSVVYTTFSSATTTLTFREAGLVSNTTWSVVITGYGAATSQDPSVTFTLPQSTTYTYHAQAVAGYTTPAGGSVNLGTTHQAVSLTYVSISGSYALKFVEAGLPTGSTWSVSVGRAGASYAQSTTTANVTFFEVNGTYTVDFSLPAGYVAPALKPHVVVNGASLVINYTFALAADTFVATFTEGGLPVGTLWNVTIANLTFGSTSNQVVLALANGSYPWTLSSISGYLQFPENGTLTVSGANVSFAVGFVIAPAEFTVTFTETALPSGDSWTVYFNGQTTTSTSRSISFSATNGSWTYYVVPPTGYQVTPNGGSLGVHGKAQAVPVTFSPVPSTSSKPAWSYLGELAYGVIGGLAVLLVVGFALAAHYRGRRKAAAPPESWTEGGPPAGGGAPPAAGTPPPEGKNP